MTATTPKIVRYKRRPLTDEQIAELQALADLPDDQIDFSDMPETTDADWVDAVRGRFYHPVKRQLTLRLDADIIDWFKRQVPNGKGYQTEINKALRQHIAREVKAAAKRAG